MNHASVVLVRCPSTGRELSAGVEMDTATFERLSDIHSLISVPFPFGRSPRLLRSGEENMRTP